MRGLASSRGPEENSSSLPRSQLKHLVKTKPRGARRAEQQHEVKKFPKDARGAGKERRAGTSPVPHYKPHGCLETAPVKETLRHEVTAQPHGSEFNKKLDYSLRYITGFLGMSCGGSGAGLSHRCGSLPGQVIL